MAEHEFLFDRENGTLLSHNFETGESKSWHVDGVARWRLKFKCEDEPLLLSEMRGVSIITGKKIKNEEPASSTGTNTESS